MSARSTMDFVTRLLGALAAPRGRRRLSRCWRLLAAALLFATSSWFGGGGAAAARETRREPIPLLAYYYIWFDVTSWDRAKTDYPLLGRYSSDDRVVMHQHVRWAREAGIGGFIVSWKSTPVLNKRLAQLIEIAAAEDFKLAIIYQGLDFERRPLPADRIAADLDYFAYRWGHNPALHVFDRPVVIWSGTWEFSRDDVARVASSVRPQLLLLASERNLDGFRRLADLVDGNAYYWSSVDPDTFPGYQEKLDAMSRAVHERGGLWVAPAAPGFDARLIGGTRVVDRHDGDTLRRQLDTALRSAPDAVGLISWNEFSENSHIEPSEKYGTQSLKALAAATGAKVPEVGDFDSSAPGTTGTIYGLPLLGALALLLIVCTVVIARRRVGKQRNDLRLQHESRG